MTRLLTLAAAVALAGVAAAQPPSGSYRPVDPVTLPLDRDNVWTLHFAYTPPRIATLDVPGKGKKTVWYMVYQVWNTGDTPRTVIPRFELVTQDGPRYSLLDDLSPALAEQVRAVEDPTKSLNMQSSVSISKTPVPVTRADSVPRSVYGIALWPDVAEKAPTVNNFSVFVTGLSNGTSVAKAEGGAETITRKTLQLDFIRPTDNRNQTLGDIRPNENGGLGAYRWLYRVTPVRPTPPPAKQ
jgi:hypothetical protein